MQEVDSFPEFPTLRKLTFEDNVLLENIFRQTQPQMSELTFTNLYVWSETEPVQLTRVGQIGLLQRKRISDNNSVFLPLVGRQPFKQLLDELSNYRLPEYPSIVLYVSAEHVEEFKTKGIPVESDRNNSDYVYLTSELADLPGDRYHSKRNFIKRCLSNYRCEYRPIDSQVIKDCLQLQTEWCNLRRCEEASGLDAENRAIRGLFEAYERLSVTGGAVYVDGKLQAFTIAESLNSDTAVIHFEKANPEIIGLYQVINSWFCQNALKDFTFVNREQDLGVPGLRKAKMSYHPHHMAEKCLATFEARRYLANTTS